VKEWKCLVVSLIAVVVFLCFVEKANAAGNKERYVENAGKFSISIPTTWDATKVKGLRYKILRGTFEDNFAPSINFSDEAFSGQFYEYIVYIKEELNKIFGENIEYILQSEFVTLKGLKGEIIVITTYQQERLIQQSFFCFPSNNEKNIIITCVNLAGEYGKYNKLFDETVKTFEWLN
jgi:hypothetical protein